MVAQGSPIAHASNCSHGEDRRGVYLVRINLILHTTRTARDTIQRNAARTYERCEAAATSALHRAKKGSKTDNYDNGDDADSEVQSKHTSASDGRGHAGARLGLWSQS